MDDGTRSLDEVLAEASKPWYSYGRSSLGILVARFRNGHQWGFRLRMAWQRATKGHSESDLWSLNTALANLTVSGVRYMREAAHGYPAEFSPELGGEGWPKWDAILARIEAGFQAWLDEDGWFHDKPEAKAKFDDAMALYVKWFGALWD